MRTGSRNRAIVVLNQARMRRTDAYCAYQVLSRLVGDGATVRPSTSVESVRRALARAVPVVATLQLPIDAPDRDGVLAIDADRDLVERTVVVTAYSDTRRAYRILECKGIKWGQLGRAWIPRRDFERVFKNAGIPTPARSTAASAA